MRVFERIGRGCVRAPWLIVCAWIAVAVALAMTVVPLTTVVESQKPQLLPPQAMAATEQMAADFGESAQNSLVVVLSDANGMGAAGEDAYRVLGEKLRAQSGDVAAVHDYLETPALRDLMVSADGKASYLLVNLTAPAGSPESTAAYQRVTDLVKQSASGTMTANVTGQAAIVGDLSSVGARDMHVIEIATALLVLAILGLIYRRPVTMLLPLITIGVTVVAAQGTVSALTGAGLQVSSLTVVLMTAMIVGAGTDYAVFIISRYHEYLRAGDDSDTAVQRALGSIGEVIAASAATVAVTFVGMVFTTLPAFTSIGPALAVSIAVAFLAAITLLPALIVLAGRRGWVAPRGAAAGRFWGAMGVRIVRRPKVYLMASLTVLLVLAGFVFCLNPTYNDRNQLPATAESNRGYDVMAGHFSANALLPQYIYIRSPQDLRNPQALADLEQMAQRVAQVPDVAGVRGITRPGGQQIEETKVSHQAGQVGATLDDASAQIASRTGDLDALSNGADQLADSLATVRDQVGQAAGSATAVTETVAQVRQELMGPGITGLLASVESAAGALAADPGPINALVAAAPAMLTALSTPQCDADPLCAQGRESLRQLTAAPDAGTAQNLVAAARQLSSLVQTATAALQSGGIGDPAAIQAQIAQMQQGADQLATGSRTLSDGVGLLVDQTKKVGVGISQAAGALLTLQRDAATPSMSGMYVPPQALESDDFRKASTVFVSPDGHAVRYAVESKLDPFSPAGMDQVHAILAAAQGAQPNTALADATISMVGTTPTYAAIRDLYEDDLRLIVALTLGVVFVILMLLLRAVVAPLYLIGTVVIAFASALGLSVLVFQVIGGQQLYWNVAAIAFIVLVAVGADYNLLLISRIREESGNGIRSGIIRAVRSTGGVITSAGIIFAASMFGLVFGSITTMVQTGFLIGTGLLIDTFLVRTVTVPALAALFGQANWWPRKSARPMK